MFVVQCIMFIIPWVLTAFRGALIFSATVVGFNALFGANTISWYILWFAIPSHVLADFAGFCNVVYSDNSKPAILGPCYSGLVALAVACGFIIGFWAGLLVFLEGWLLGLPAGYKRTQRDLGIG